MTDRLRWQTLFPLLLSQLYLFFSVDFLPFWVSLYPAVSGECEQSSATQGRAWSSICAQGGEQRGIFGVYRGRNLRESWKVSWLGWRLLPLQPVAKELPAAKTIVPGTLGMERAWSSSSSPREVCWLLFQSQPGLTPALLGGTPGDEQGREECVCIPTLSACDSHRTEEGSHLLQPLLWNPEDWIRALAAWLGRWFQSKAPGSPFVLTKMPFIPAFSHAGNLALTQSNPSKNPWIILAIQGNLPHSLQVEGAKKPFCTKAFFLCLCQCEWGKSLTLTEQIKINPAMDKANYVLHCLGMGSLICSWQRFDGLNHPFSDPAFEVIFIVNQSLPCRTLRTMVSPWQIPTAAPGLVLLLGFFLPSLTALTRSGKCWPWLCVPWAQPWWVVWEGQCQAHPQHWGTHFQPPHCRFGRAAQSSPPVQNMQTAH